MGKYITKELIITILKRLGIRITAKQIAKYLPVIVQVISGVISFGAMKYIINLHINECYEVCKEILKNIEKR